MSEITLLNEHFANGCRNFAVQRIAYELLLVSLAMKEPKSLMLCNPHSG